MPVALSPRSENQKMSPDIANVPWGQRHHTESHCSSAKWVLSHSQHISQITVSVLLIIFCIVSSFLEFPSFMFSFHSSLSYQSFFCPSRWWKNPLLMHILAMKSPFWAIMTMPFLKVFNSLCTWFESINSSNWTLFYHWGPGLISSQTDCRLYKGA